MPIGRAGSNTDDEKDHAEPLEQLTPGWRDGSAEEAAIRDLGPEGDDNFSGSGRHVQPKADGDYSQRPVD